ncbi:MAG TPA: guanine deaminase [Candidatus Acidoferrales bacterium]|nr:guanine deaminase [Candidatus Acidoferrales bacterium]
MVHVCAHRGAILYFVTDPGEGDDPAAHVYHEDGLLVIDSGHVAAVGPAATLLPQLSPAVTVTEHADALIMPGFVDAHIHFPQTDMIASGGRDLLDWLARYTYPAERRFGDPGYARAVADFFINELLANGTTTAQVLGSVHAASVDAVFAAAVELNLRLIAGKALMDRHCPADLCDTAASGERDTRALIERWHNRDRLRYAITPRFAPTSTEAQLTSAGRLAAEFPDVHVHSHLAENLAEVAWTRELFPWSRSYTDVYDHYGLLRPRAVYAHGIHLSDQDRQRLAETGTWIAHAPSSNLYLGSGLFDFAASDAAQLRYAISTDVGAGTSFSLLRTLGDAYKVAQLQGQRLSPLRAFYLATLAGARALDMDHCIGTFRPGAEADFIVLDLAATPLIARRCAQAATLAERLQILMTLGDDRCIRLTHVLGRPVAGTAHRARS